MPAFSEFRSERLSVEGVALHVRHAGSGQAVVLMHRWCGSSHGWRFVAPRLANDHHVIVPDMRGSGAPTLAVAGEHGIAGIAEEIRQAVPEASGVVIGERGHLVPEERPAELERVLRGHFSRIQK